MFAKVFIVCAARLIYLLIGVNVTFARMCPLKCECECVLIAPCACAALPADGFGSDYRF